MSGPLSSALLRSREMADRSARSLARTHDASQPQNGMSSSSSAFGSGSLPGKLERLC